MQARGVDKCELNTPHIAPHHLDPPGGFPEGIHPTDRSLQDGVNQLTLPGACHSYDHDLDAYTQFAIKRGCLGFKLLQT